MNANELIKKLQDEVRKYGDIPVIADTPSQSGEVVDVAVYDSVVGKRIWISSQEPE